MQNDDDLRARFHSLSNDADAHAPDLSAGDIRAWRSALHLQRRRTMGVGMVVGMTAGIVVTLTVGLVLGASTGYASAGEIVMSRGDQPLPPQPTLAVLKNIPNITSLSCITPATVAALPQQKQQQGVPVIDLPAPTVKSTELFRAVLGTHQLSNGSLLVNDAQRHSVRILDTSLALQSVARDSMPGSANSYGLRPSPMIRYVGDSSLMIEQDAGVLLVLGPNGQVARTMAPVTQDMLRGLGTAFGGSDDRGRVVHEVRFRGPAGADSVFIVRSDPDTRRVDTLARARALSGTKLMGGRGDASSPIRFSADPAPVLDQWAQLSDGSIAIVRGQDFHIDWIHPDGTTHSTGKLPFDWKRLTDEDKQRLIDSTREAAAPTLGKALGAAPEKLAAIAAAGVGGGDPGQKPTAGNSAPSNPNTGAASVEYLAPSLKDLPDYYPALRRNSVLPDMDGNLWILPTSSAQSKNGELVYDVVNVKGDFRRVRIPLGRSIVGFGKGGIVYLLNGDRTNGFYLEKSKLPSR